MRLTYKSRCYKVKAVLRFLVFRMFNLGKFRCPKLSMIGKGSEIYILKNGKIDCSDRIIVDDQVMLFAKGEIKIGKQFGINRFSRIVAHQQITIGDFVTIGQMVSILDHDHQYISDGKNIQLNGYKTAPIKIGNNIWIGDKCTVLKGVTIGDNVVVGANTLVHKDVPPGVVIGGNPFKILKEIHPSQVKNPN